MPQIEVTFDIDANGILHVSAKDLGTGKEQKITITASSGLVQRRDREDAQGRRTARGRRSQQRKEEIEARNEADNAVYRSEKMLKDNKEKISEATDEAFEAALNEVKEALKGTDAAAIKTASEKLNEAWQAVSAELIQSGIGKSQGRSRTGRSAGGPGGPEAGSRGGAGSRAGGQGRRPHH